MNKIYLQVVVLPDKCFVTSNDINFRYYPDIYFINNEPLKKSYKEYWYEISSIPKQLQVKKKTITQFKHYELKDTFEENFLLGAKKIMTYDEMKKLFAIHYPSLNSDEDDDYYNKYDSMVGMFYNTISETIPESYEDVPFEITLIATRESDWKFVKPIEPITFSIVDELTTHPDLLFEKECSISSSDFFDIVSEYLKKNLDRQIISLFSLTDSLTVYKLYDFPKVGTIQKKSVRKTRNQLNNDPKKKTVLELKRNSMYNSLAPIIANSYPELKEKMNKFLEDLLFDLNKPIQICPHCNGEGYLN